MAAMTKRVNVQAKVAVRNTNPPVYGRHDNIVMTTSDILKCLCRRAIVDEIMPDGSLVRLNMKNYYLDNGAGLTASNPVRIVVPKEKRVEKPVEPKVEEPVKVEETKEEVPEAPAVEETAEAQVVETTGPIENEVETQYVVEDAAVVDEAECEQTLTAETTEETTEPTAEEANVEETAPTASTAKKSSKKKSSK